MLEMVAHAYNPESLKQEDGLEIKDNLDYIERPCLKQQTKEVRLLHYYNQDQAGLGVQQSWLK